MPTRVRRDALGPPIGRLLRTLLALSVLAMPALGAPSLNAQERSSHYLYLGHWAYRYVDLLMARGHLPDLQPMVRPYRRLDVAMALANARSSGGLAESEIEWVELLQAELAPELLGRQLADSATVVVYGGAEVGAQVLTQRHRDMFRPEGDEAAFGHLQLAGALDFPGVTAALRLRYDGWLINDPQFPDGKVVEEHPNFLGLLDFAARAEDGYAEVQLPYVRLMAGRMQRNWGPPRTEGLLVSDYSYSYDQIGYRIGSTRLAVTGFVAQLDEFPDFTKRWFAAHRLDWRVNDGLALGFGESVIWGGENRSFDFRMAMPIATWFVGGYGKDWEEGPNRNNSFIDLSVWWKPTAKIVTTAAVMFDDFPGGGSPLAHGVDLGLALPSLSSRLGLRIGYAQVGALTYRTVSEYERYAFRGIGLGRDLADFDRLSVELDWVPTSSLFLTPTVQVLRRGEGDFRDPWPAGVTNDGPVLFIGERETTLRLALRGQWIPRRLFWIDWDVGENLVWSAGHVPGQRANEFVGRLRVSLVANAWGKL
ncbi:MAG: capsule assembly Wzi family protein [Gemmatimonadota bacterium]|nr:capsule assembly Wzi family protein [Gemmatimonadota bacterium]MDH3368300.1 capsule assembly Wzi family protein [Gemmatimonadota bacterium]